MADRNTFQDKSPTRDHVRSARFSKTEAQMIDNYAHQKKVNVSDALRKLVGIGLQRARRR